jgi:acyl-CoA synthetase (AMP-forming)/AMP-acid ligase II
VVARTPASPTLREDFVLFCKEHFPHQLVPREIVFRDELPKNSAGKVLKQELRTA